MRDVQISRNGESWKSRDGIAELTPFFSIVERATTQAAPPPLPMTTTSLRRSEPSGPLVMGNPIAIGEPAFTAASQLRNTPAAMSVSGDSEVDFDDEFETRTRHCGVLVAGALAALVLVGAVTYLAAFKRAAVRGLFSQSDARAGEAYRQGREYFLLDTDDGFRQAVAAFERSHALNEKNALALAGLAEVKATWAQYLREDARALEGAAPTVTATSAANTLRREAQFHLDDAKRYANDALTSEPDAVEVNRAMATYLRVDGAPTVEVERYLDRALARRPGDPETAYERGALAQRDGQLDVARARLAEANQLSSSTTQQVLLRACHLLARVLIVAGDRAGAKKQLEELLATHAQHDRARALLASLEAAPASPAAPPAMATPAPPTAPDAPTAAVAPAPSSSGHAERSKAEPGSAISKSTGKDSAQRSIGSSRRSPFRRATERR
jgi:hypothetical protein